MIYVCVVRAAVANAAAAAAFTCTAGKCAKCVELEKEEESNTMIWCACVCVLCVHWNYYRNRDVIVLSWFALARTYLSYDAFLKFRVKDFLSIYSIYMFTCKL